MNMSRSEFPKEGAPVTANPQSPAISPTGRHAHIADINVLMLGFNTVNTKNVLLPISVSQILDLDTFILFN